jgi:hypothetical protein
MKYKIAVLDDYQNAALESADWSVIRDRADITVFQDHLNDTDAVIERLPNLKCIASTGPVNASIDVVAAADRGIVVSHTGYRSDPGFVSLPAGSDKTLACPWSSCSIFAVEWTASFRRRSRFAATRLVAFEIHNEGETDGASPRASTTPLRIHRGSRPWC